MTEVTDQIGEENNDSDKPEKSEEDKKDTPKTRYDDINPQLLKCHICNKSMWDGRSFENHLSGRAHAIMMQKTAESYALTADTMRQEFKIREMKRTRKAGQQPPRDFYCAMCDMYAADGAIHRTTVGHRKLKKYLHPTCTSCHKEMPTRIELDEHRLTAEHLKNMQDKQEVISKPKPEVMIISTLNMEQMYLRDDRQRWRRGERQDRDKDEPEKDSEAKKEEGEVEVKKEQEDVEVKQEPEVKKESVDNETTILDYKEGDDITNMTAEMLPYYSTERGVGRSFLSPFSCVQCTLCRKLLDSDETAEVHLRTWRHHQLFVRLLGDKSGNQTLQPTAEQSSKRALNNDDSGTWKRRKTTRDDEEEEPKEQNGHDNTVKKEPAETEAEVEANLFNEDGDLPAADELEDWEQSVDEILYDENKRDDKPEEKEVETPVEEEPKAAEPEEVKATPPATQPKPSPTGRGRGRRRY
ncbi:zinc finger protein on ecdysone puffs isoform X2 [Vanessa cardui]|uniref:zinc finger protein on ecdysone puffs isoform X2 n=1 Tax=Vanessa cardui TaxID=171605 RepID=UPI001F1435A6|nr:zinc finger protein on ecdysone puffs isoform X2 [Vanessa cardui]